MSPWDILGWILVIWLGLIFAIKLLIIGLDIFVGVRRYLRQYIRHLRTRNTPPAAGQYWCGAGLKTYEVTRVHDNGVIGVRFGNGSWGDTPEQWKRRVRNLNLYLGRTR